MTEPDTPISTAEKSLLAQLDERLNAYRLTLNLDCMWDGIPGSGDLGDEDAPL